MLAFAAFLSFIFLFYGTSSIQFIACYITVLFSFVSTTTIVYDQHSNGMGFLLTLPVSRSSYAREKYLLMFFVMAGSLAMSFAVLLIGVCIKRIPFDGDLLLKVLLSSALLSVLTHALLIPLQLKFEAEKGRVVFMVIIGLVYAVIFGGRALILHFHIDVPALFMLYCTADLSGVQYNACRRLPFGIHWQLPPTAMTKKSRSMQVYL